MFSPTTSNVTVVSSGGESCPVCGETGTNCRGEYDYDGAIQFIPPKPSDDPGATFTVPHRVFSETTVGKRTVRKLLYPVGARIRPAEARRLGLLGSDSVAT